MESKEQLELLRTFVDLIKSKPSILHEPQLSFFKDWLLSMGATIPPKTATATSGAAPNGSHNVDLKPDESSSESEIEFDDDAEIIRDSTEAQQEMGDESIEVTEEMIEQANEKRSEAQCKLSDGDFEGAVSLFTDAIKLNPSSALLYARRASCYVKLKRPNAAIRDCDKAIALNPDSATPYKWRGLAYKMCGEWKKAYEDLQMSQRLDYSDDAYEALKELEPKFKRIHEHEMKYERKRMEKRDEEYRRRVKQAQEAREKAKQEAEVNEPDLGNMGDTFSQLFNDPELMEALQDPEVMKAFSEVSSNPAAMLNYQNNPKVKKVLEKMKNKFGGAGMGGGMPFGGMPGFTKPASAHSAPDLD